MIFELICYPAWSLFMLLLTCLFGASFEQVLTVLLDNNVQVFSFSLLPLNDVKLLLFFLKVLKGLPLVENDDIEVFRCLLVCTILFVLFDAADCLLVLIPFVVVIVCL